MSMIRYKHEENDLFKVGMYLRLSQEDKVKKECESNSIENQRRIIKNYIDNSNDLVFIDEYSDDGWSGTNFDRPGFQRMLNDIQNKKIDTIIVKDLSRFGRNYIEVGWFLEDTFPTLKIRFISIIDRIDSFKNPESSNSMLVNFKNLINDEYARDISRKTKSSLNTKKKKGDYVAGSVPFGYKRDINNKYHLVIDEEAANIVKIIFELAMEGKGTLEISNYLNERNIITSLQYKKMKGLKCSHNNVNFNEIDNLKWSPTAVATILRNEVYLGNTIQNKYSHVSYKIHKCQKNPEDKWTKVENTHEAIVSKDMFDYINERLFSKIVKIRSNNKYSLFSGFLLCSDCNRGLHYQEGRKARKDGTKLKYYVCGTNKYNVNNCSSHIIHEDKLKDIVIKAINKQIKLVNNANDSLEIIINNKKTSVKKEVLENNKKSLMNNIEEKMKLKQNIYTDWKDNIITFEDYREYSKNYTDEISRYKESLNLIEQDLRELDSIRNYQKDLIDTFYNKGQFKELNRDMLFNFIDRIIIYEENKVDIIFKYNDIYINLLKYIKKIKSF